MSHQSFGRFPTFVFVLLGIVSVSAAQDVVSLRIEGPDEVDEESTAYYTVYALFDNGREYDVTLDCDLSLDPGVFASIGPFGDFQAAEVARSEVEVIRAKYASEFGEAIAEHAVTIQDSESSPVYGLEFDGQDDVVKVARSASLEPTEALTVECWANGLGGASNAVLVRKANGADAGFVLRWKFRGDNRVYFQLAKDNLREEIWVVNPISNSAYEGEWHHFAGVYSASGNFARLYVDGELVAEKRGYGLLENSGDLYFGSFNGSEAFRGQLDEVRYWTIARSQEQIQCSMNRSLRGDEAGLVGYWRLNEGEGQDAFDASPYGNHGRLGQNGAGDPADPRWIDSEAGISEPPTDCEIDCGAIERFRAKCRAGRLVAKVTSTLRPGTQVRIDNQGDLKTVIVDESGGAKAVWLGQSGRHEVFILGCEGFSDAANCGG